MNLSAIAKVENITLIKQVFKVNFENNYYFKLYYFLKTSQLVKKNDTHYFSYF